MTALPRRGCGDLPDDECRWSGGAAVSLWLFLGLLGWILIWTAIVAVPWLLAFAFLAMVVLWAAVSAVP